MLAMLDDMQIISVRESQKAVDKNRTDGERNEGDASDEICGEQRRPASHGQDYGRSVRRTDPA